LGCFQPTVSICARNFDVALRDDLDVRDVRGGLKAVSVLQLCGPVEDYGDRATCVSRFAKKESLAVMRHCV
jgi:hypothetical protein